MRSPHITSQNLLIAALPEADGDRLLELCEYVPMPLGQLVYESGGRQDYVYFPTTCIVSHMYMLRDGASVEFAVVGFEGMVGTSILMGGETTISRAVVRGGGHGYRMKAHLIKAEFERGGPTQRLLLRYAQALMTQTMQTAVCNRHHSVEQHLCRTLLLTLDRAAGAGLPLTQELISTLLGVRRASVTEAAGNLQGAGLVRSTRGHIEVLDRERLERAVCECYGCVKREFDRLLPDAITA
jgi:CRP-like cAMP-binding protein